MALRDLQVCFFSAGADVAFWTQLNLGGLSVAIVFGIQM